MEQGNLFSDLRRNATDEEVMQVLRIAIARGGRLPRLAELYLSSVCVEHLLEELRLAELEVVHRLIPDAEEGGMTVPRISLDKPAQGSEE
jgi:hypothetical protein